MIFRAPGLEFVRGFIFRVALPFHHNSRRLRFAGFFLFGLLLLDTLWTLSIHTPSAKSQLLGNEGSELTHVYQQRLYIAALHYNDEALLRKHWIPALLDLLKHWEPERIYVSISESGSLDGTKNALRDFDHKLGRLRVERAIQLSNRTHEDEVTRPAALNEPGWIWTSSGEFERRRISYLAAERNRAMEMLNELAQRKDNPRIFDKVLWLNDVIFNTEQVAALINTRHGDYGATCSLDFLDPPKYPVFYDTFALRDISGHPALTQHWPYFSSPLSRDALISYSPVPVESCWNGMVVFSAEPFYHDPPLRFRAIPDSLAAKHLEGSECCLIHVDNPLVKKRGLWLNPNVRVTYNEGAHRVVNPGNGKGWPGKWEVVKGIWVNRWMWSVGWPWRWSRERKLRRRVREWEVGERREGGGRG